MVEPNFNLMLWILLITYSIGAISNIIAGLFEVEKSNKYGVADALLGIFELVLVLWIMIG